MGMEYEITKTETEAVFTLVGELSAGTQGANLLKDVTTKIDADAARVILDLSDVHYVNSSGFGVLMQAVQRLKTRNIEVALVNPIAPAVRSVFRMSKVHRIVPTFGNLRQALEFGQDRAEASTKHSENPA